ncbi:MAG: methylated-DNA--[protein]-cysteine S-methyltransferase [Ignavibacteria bacterium]|nr:methylated-DNA--[protein]-cysteine S-methyltransferase [Ignavibacteria bacterium]
MKIQKYFLRTKIGTLKITADEKFIYSINFSTPSSNPKNTLKTIKECVKQLKEYFNRKRREFNLPLKLEGTEFQKKVWKELMKIPYGKVVSYSYIAEKINSPNSVRAVGNANNRNKFAIIIPCHRVIAKNGTLSGYAAGITKKKWLIDFESSNK